MRVRDCMTQVMVKIILTACSVWRSVKILIWAAHFLCETGYTRLEIYIYQQPPSHLSTLKGDNLSVTLSYTTIYQTYADVHENIKEDQLSPQHLLKKFLFSQRSLPQCTHSTVKLTNKSLWVAAHLLLTAEDMFTSNNLMSGRKKMTSKS